MGKRLYVGSISFSAAEESLRDLCTSIGEVESVKIITHADTGRSKGFGFIEMSSAEDAKKAIDQLNGTKFMERANEARPQQPREGRGFGGGSGGFGQGRGSGYGRTRR
jgi:RNA recognition motif-containing protein